jgi:hypothetical protein
MGPFRPSLGLIVSRPFLCLSGLRFFQAPLRARPPYGAPFFGPLGRDAKKTQKHKHKHKHKNKHKHKHKHAKHKNKTKQNKTKQPEENIFLKIEKTNHFFLQKPGTARDKRTHRPQGLTFRFSAGSLEWQRRPCAW